jgi:hypothetical protein
VPRRRSIDNRPTGEGLTRIDWTVKRRRMHHYIVACLSTNPHFRCFIRADMIA